MRLPMHLPCSHNVNRLLSTIPATTLRSTSVRGFSSSPSKPHACFSVISSQVGPSAIDRLDTVVAFSAASRLLCDPSPVCIGSFLEKIRRIVGGMMNGLVPEQTNEERVRDVVQNAGLIDYALCDIQAGIGAVASSDAGNIHMKRRHVKELLEEKRRLIEEVSLYQKAVQHHYGCESPNVAASGDAPSGTTDAKKSTVAREEKPATRKAEESTNRKSGPAEESKKEPKDAKKKKKESEPAKPAEKEEIHPGRLDFRVGKIVECDRHPDADALYVEKIDLAEANPRTIVSGLVKHVPVEEMRGRLVVVLCNLKPAKMRGITSEGMVMCASTPEKVEILVPPGGAVPGDVITFAGFPRNPDPVLNPKKKIWETLMPDFRTGEDGVAKFKDVSFEVEGKGVVTSSTLTGVQIK